MKLRLNRAKSESEEHSRKGIELEVRIWEDEPVICFKRGLEWRRDEQCRDLLSDVLMTNV